MIKIERPPNFELILAAFPDADKPGIIFAFGPDVYNPSAVDIPLALLAHEAVHQHRQLRDGSTVELWWKNYLADAEFRYREELAAHVAEFKAQPTRDRNAKARLLVSTAQRLIAPLYNYKGTKSIHVAMRDLRWELE